ncbi:MAG: hypothetical protein AB8I08_30115, partial [Sandaracinaceae bacterium]
MKYLCVHCDKTFEHDDDAPKKARCPECLRVNGLEEVKSAKPGEAARPPWMMWAAAGAALVAAGVGYTLWAGEASETVTGDVPLAPLDQGAIDAQLNARAVDARELARMLVPSETVTSWAEANTSGSTPAAKAESLLEAIRSRAEAGAFERWSMGVPRDTPISGSDDTLEALSEDGGRHHLYPLEVATLMAAGLRSVDVDAMVAEAIAFPGDRTPPDPSGQFGYYVVAMYPNGAGEGDPAFSAPYSGREVAPGDHRVLTDVQAIAAGLSTRSLHLLSRESDPERAMEASS